MRKDQEAASINAYLRQKRQVAEAEATGDVPTEQDDALDAPVQEDVGGFDVACRAVERVAFATLPAVVRVQVLPATRYQLVVTHSGEPRDLLAIRASEWFARVAASRRRLADQPDLVRLDLLLFHDAGQVTIDRCWTSTRQSVVLRPEKRVQHFTPSPGTRGRDFRVS
jgi:hypothetical protein